MYDKNRISINQAITRIQWDFRQSVEGYARHGVHGVGVWRDKLQKTGLKEAKKLLDDHRMTVTGLCTSGPFMFESEADKQAAFDDAVRAVDEAAEINASCLFIFPGGLLPGSKNIAGSRDYMEEVVERLLGVARAAGVTLALEPLHPALAADRSCLNTMAAANDICERLGDGIGIVVDVYHVWWDPTLEDEINRAGKDRLLGFHINDWRVPTRHPVFDRAMMGDGIIDIAQIWSWMDSAGFDGSVEIEIFSKQDWWKADPNIVVETCLERCKALV